MTSGALLIDKHEGVSSAEIVRVLKRRFGFSRIGHAGTLDPAATGLLVILIGEATKLQDFVLVGRKRYSGVIRLGVSTDTDDLTGTVLQEDFELSGVIGGEFNELEKLLQRRFSGALQQVPPAFSAIKVDGSRSYDRARRGEDVVLKPRLITIFDCSFKFVDRNRLNYVIECSKGTYIRSVARDVGSVLNVPACAESIRRLKSGEFDVAHAVKLEKLTTESQLRAALIGLSELVGELPKVELDHSSCERLYLGQQGVLSERIEVTSSNTVALFGPQGVAGLAERQDSRSPWRIRFLFHRSETPQ